MDQHIDVFVGIDVAKSRNAIAIADSERGGEVRYFGEVDAAPDAMRRAVQRITAKHGRAHFCYEAGPTGYGLFRLITGMGYGAYGDCQDFRVWAGIMGKKEPHYVPTQRTCDPV